MYYTVITVYYIFNTFQVFYTIFTFKMLHELIFGGNDNDKISPVTIHYWKYKYTYCIMSVYKFRKPINQGGTDFEDI